jgi:hypothetical protein
VGSLPRSNRLAAADVQIHNRDDFLQRLKAVQSSLEVCEEEKAQQIAGTQPLRKTPPFHVG